MWLQQLCLVFLVIIHGSDAGSVSSEYLENGDSDKSQLEEKRISSVETGDEGSSNINVEQQFGIYPNYEESVRLFDSRELAPQLPDELFEAESGLKLLRKPGERKKTKKNRKKNKNRYLYIADEKEGIKQDLWKDKNGLAFRGGDGRKPADESSTIDKEPDDESSTPGFLIPSLIPACTKRPPPPPPRSPPLPRPPPSPTPQVIGEIKRQMKKLRKQIKKLICKICKQPSTPESTGSDTPGSDTTGEETPGEETTGEGTTGEGTTGEETTKEKTTKEKTTKEETTKEETTKEETTGEETTKEKTTKEKTSKEETSKEETTGALPNTT